MKKKSKFTIHFFLFIMGCFVCLWNTYSFAQNVPITKSNFSSKIIQPIRVQPNELVVHKSELCSQNSTAVESQLSPTGDIIVWCETGPKPKPIHPVILRPNEFLLRGSDLCPESLMAIDTKVSSSGDILIWCAEVPQSTVSKK